MKGLVLGLMSLGLMSSLASASTYTCKVILKGSDIVVSTYTINASSLYDARKSAEKELKKKNSSSDYKLDCK